MQNHSENIRKSFLEPRHAKLKIKCKSTCKKSIQIHVKFREIHSEAPTTSSHMPSPHPPVLPLWEEVMCAPFWIPMDFPWILVDFLHVDSHLYLDYLQSIYRRQILTAKIGLYLFPKFTPFLFYYQVNDL